MKKLFLLGPVKVLNVDKESAGKFLRGPKRIAVLTYLLLLKPQGFQRRDSLLPVFWPEMNQKSARNALSNILYHIRKTFGEDTILNRGSEEICINNKNIWVDILALYDHYKQDRYQKALELYKQNLLKGFHVSNCSAEFEEWLENERENTLEIAINCAKALVENAASSEARTKWLSKLLQFREIDDEAQAELLNTLLAMGRHREASRTLKKYEALLKSEGLQLSTRLTSLKNKIEASLQQEIELKDPSQEASRVKLAILPFNSRTGNRNIALSNGFYDDLHNCLSGQTDLDIISKTSVSKIDINTPSLQIAEKLGVGFILKGKFYQSGKHL